MKPAPSATGRAPSSKRERHLEPRAARRLRRGGRVRSRIRLHDPRHWVHRSVDRVGLAAACSASGHVRVGSGLSQAVSALFARSALRSVPREIRLQGSEEAGVLLTRGNLHRVRERPRLHDGPRAHPLRHRERSLRRLHRRRGMQAGRAVCPGRRMQTLTALRRYRRFSNFIRIAPRTKFQPSPCLFAKTFEPVESLAPEAFVTRAHVNRLVDL